MASEGEETVSKKEGDVNAGEHVTAETTIEDNKELGDLREV